MIDNKSIQRSLASQGFFKGEISGEISAEVIAAIDAALAELPSVGEIAKKWTEGRKLIAYQQYMMATVGIEAGTVDGLVGPQTLFALEEWQNKLRDVPGESLPPAVTAQVTSPEAQFKLQPPPEVAKENNPHHPWPRQSEVPKFYGVVGKSQVLLVPPYQFYLYDTRQKINRISVHAKVRDAAERVFRKVLEAYGPQEIHRLHLDRFFGSFFVRRMRGGNAWSMHSWGIAFDFDASRNQLRWGKDRAVFAKPEYRKWFEAWYSEGAISLGLERNYDFMHCQFARL